MKINNKNDYGTKKIGHNTTKQSSFMWIKVDKQNSLSWLHITHDIVVALLTNFFFFIIVIYIRHMNSTKHPPCSTNVVRNIGGYKSNRAKKTCLLTIFDCVFQEWLSVCFIFGPPTLKPIAYMNDEEKYSFKQKIKKI